MILEKRVTKLEEIVKYHEKRLSLIESKFDFIKNQLNFVVKNIENLNPKKYKIAIGILIGLILGIMIAGVIL